MPLILNPKKTGAEETVAQETGAEEFIQVGTEQSKGTRLFCVSGACEYPGTYEAPLGTPLSDLLEEAGATEGARVLLGGAAGAFVSQDQHDVPLSFEDTSAAGLTLGSGAVIVMTPKLI